MIRKGMYLAVTAGVLALCVAACDDRQDNDLTDTDRDMNATGTNSGTVDRTPEVDGTTPPTNSTTNPRVTPADPATPTTPATPGVGPGDGTTAGVDFTELRDRAVREWNEQLDELQPTIDRAKERLGTMDASVKNAAEAAVNEAEMAMQDARNRLEEIGEATEAGWQSIREDTTALMDRVRTEVQELEPYTK